MSNVRNYTDKEIIDRIKTLPSFKTIPTNYFLVGVRSDEDAFNLFDDKFYLFKGEKCVAVWRGTTNAGSDLLNPTNKRGEAVLKADGIYYDSHTRRKHRGKVMAYCQAKSLPIYRDNNKNKKTEETGTANLETVGINIHPSSYQTGSTAPRSLINAWSQGCQVFAVRSDFDKFMRLTEGQQNLTYCLLKEFTPSKASKVSATVPATKPATKNQPAETDNSAENPSVLTPETYEQPPNESNAVETAEIQTETQTATVTTTKNEQSVHESADVAEPKPQGIFAKLTAGIGALFSGTFIYTLFEKIGGITISNTVLILIIVAVVLAFLGFCFWAWLDAVKANNRVKIEAEAKTNINKKDVNWV